MNRRLFFGHRLQRPTAARVRELASTLLADPCLSPFRLWVVGSYVSRPNAARDLDLLLTRRDRSALRVSEVEYALTAVRWAGVFSARMRLDAFFRSTWQDELGGTLKPIQRLCSWKLEDPALAIATMVESDGRYRRVGQYTVAFARRAANANYFRKLPILDSAKPTARYLVPAVALERYAEAGQAGPG